MSLTFQSSVMETGERSVTLCKTPKFVPYEPYKAAVKPIVPVKVKKSKKGKKEDPKSEKKMGKKEASDGGKVARVTPMTSSYDASKELQKMQKEKKELELQLNIQIKVNSDLKRLLVASVGEDLEARVHFLTQDKIKLAHDVHCYVQQLLDDHEELEKLAIQCDVWRSKFLASSLIVDELANWKALLDRRYDEALDVLQTMLEEQNKLYEQLRKSFVCLDSVRRAVDPNVPNRELKEGSIMNLSKEIDNLTKELHSLLVGSSHQCLPSAKQKIILSPAQERAKKMVNGPRISHLPFDRLLSGSSTSLRQGLAQHLYSNNQLQSVIVKCAQCSGEIKQL